MTSATLSETAGLWEMGDSVRLGADKGLNVDLAGARPGTRRLLLCRPGDSPETDAVAYE